MCLKTRLCRVTAAIIRSYHSSNATTEHSAPKYYIRADPDPTDAALLYSHAYKRFHHSAQTVGSLCRPTGRPKPIYQCCVSYNTWEVILTRPK